MSLLRVIYSVLKHFFLLHLSLTPIPPVRHNPRVSQFANSSQHPDTVHRPLELRSGGRSTQVGVEEDP